MSTECKSTGLYEGCRYLKWLDRRTGALELTVCPQVQSNASGQQCDACKNAQYRGMEACHRHDEVKEDHKPHRGQKQDRRQGAPVLSFDLFPHGLMSTF